MKDDPESREPQAPRPATAIASHRVNPGKIDAYVVAQKAITDAARMFPGFVGTEVLGPVPGLQDEWVAIFRLESNRAMQQWLHYPERLKLAKGIEELLIEPSRMLVLASDDRTEPPVAMVFTHKVAPDKVAAYLNWRRRVIAAQAHYPGYLATEFFEPHEKLDEWVDIVRYDSVRDLNEWMESKERTDLLAELDSIVESMHAHRVTGLEAGPRGFVRAIPYCDGPILSQSADAEPVDGGSDVYRQHSFGRAADLAGDASSEQVSGLLAESSEPQSETGSAGAMYSRGRPH